MLPTSKHFQSSNQVESNLFIIHTQYTKANYTGYNKCGATGRSQKANAPPMGHPVIKQFYQSPMPYTKLRIITKTHKEHKT